MLDETANFRRNADPLRAWLTAGLKKQGKSQAELARLLGVSQPRISEMLKGKRRIQAAEIPKIAEYTKEPLPTEWLSIKPLAEQHKKNEIHFGLHQNQKLLWLMIFSNRVLIEQFEVDHNDLENIRRELILAIAALQSQGRA